MRAAGGLRWIATRPASSRALLLVAMLIATAALWPGLSAAQDAPPAVQVTAVQHDPATGVLEIFVNLPQGQSQAALRDVTVVIDNVPRPVVNPVVERAPVALVLVIDTSGSMEGGPIEAARQAGAAFITRLNPDDAIAVVPFDSTVSIPAGFTAPGAAAAEVSSLQAEGETALYDAVAQGVGIFANAPEGERVVVLLSDGQDSGVSHTARADSIQAAVDSGATVHVLGFGTEVDVDYLAELASQTGGQYWTALDEDALNVVFRSLGRELGASDGISVRVPPLAQGEHRLVLSARLGDSVVSQTVPFQVTNEGLYALGVEPSDDMSAPIVVTVHGPPGLESLRLVATIDGMELPWSPGAQAPAVSVDPYAYAPGEHTLLVESFVSNALAASASIALDIPDLPPLVSINPPNNGASTYLAFARIQGDVPVRLVVTVDGDEIASATERRLEFTPPDGASEIVAQLFSGGAEPVATQQIELAGGGGSSAGGLLLLLVLLAAAGGGAWYLVQRRRARRPVVERAPDRIVARPRSTSPEAIHAESSARVAEMMLIFPDGSERSISLTRRPVTVGSAADNDICIEHPGVRSRHALLTAISPREVRVHGVGERAARPYETVESDEWIVMYAGEELAIGPYVLRLPRVAEGEGSNR